MSEIRILIVEDDPFIAMDLETAIQDELGDDARLVVVGSLQEARREAVAGLSCALLDIDVVGGKTFEVADRLMSHGTPFAFVSGSAPQELPAQLRSVRFLRKPFATAEIARFIASATRG